jgi:DNA-binding Lrp family transcriptional regulator
VASRYDLIVRAETDSMDDLLRRIVSRIQLIEGIVRTVTCTVINL